MRFLTLVEVAKQTLQKRWEELGSLGQTTIIVILLEKEAVPGFSEYIRALSPYSPFPIQLNYVLIWLLCFWELGISIVIVLRYIARRVDESEDSYFIYSVLGIAASVLAFILPQVIAVFFS